MWNPAASEEVKRETSPVLALGERIIHAICGEENLGDTLIRWADDWQKQDTFTRRNETHPVEGFCVLMYTMISANAAEEKIQQELISILREWLEHAHSEAAITGLIHIASADLSPVLQKNVNTLIQKALDNEWGDTVKCRAAITLIADQSCEVMDGGLREKAFVAALSVLDDINNQDHIAEMAKALYSCWLSTGIVLSEAEQLLILNSINKFFSMVIAQPDIIGRLKNNGRINGAIHLMTELLGKLFVDAENNVHIQIPALDMLYQLANINKSINPRDSFFLPENKAIETLADLAADERLSTDQKCKIKENLLVWFNRYNGEIAYDEIYRILHKVAKVCGERIIKPSPKLETIWERLAGINAKDVERVASIPEAHLNHLCRTAINGALLLEQEQINHLTDIMVTHVRSWLSASRDEQHELTGLFAFLSLIGSDFVPEQETIQSVINVLMELYDLRSFAEAPEELTDDMWAAIMQQHNLTENEIREILHMQKMEVQRSVISRKQWAIDGLISMARKLNYPAFLADTFANMVKDFSEILPSCDQENINAIAGTVMHMMKASWHEKYSYYQQEILPLLCKVLEKVCLGKGACSYSLCHGVALQIERLFFERHNIHHNNESGAVALANFARRLQEDQTAPFIGDFLLLRRESQVMKMMTLAEKFKKFKFGHIPKYGIFNKEIRHSISKIAETSEDRREQRSMWSI